MQPGHTKHHKVIYLRDPDNYFMGQPLLQVHSPARQLLMVYFHFQLAHETWGYICSGVHPVSFLGMILNVWSLGTFQDNLHKSISSY